MYVEHSVNYPHKVDTCIACNYYNTLDTEYCRAPFSSPTNCVDFSDFHEICFTEISGNPIVT